MMEPEDDDILGYTSDGDPLFAVDDLDEDDDNNLQSFLEEKQRVGGALLAVDDFFEDDNVNLPSLLKENKQQPRPKQQRVGGAAVCGGVTGALLAVPLIAIDVTVLAVAAPVVAVAAAGGAAFVAANTSGSPKEMVQAGGNALAKAGEEIRRRTSCKEGECKDDGAMVVYNGEEKQEEDTNPFSAAHGPRHFPWVPGVFQRRQQQVQSEYMKREAETDESSGELSSDFDESQELAADENNSSFTSVLRQEESKEEDKPAGVGLRAGGLMWLMSQKKEDLTKAEEEKTHEDVVAIIEEEPETARPRGPLHWLRRNNQVEAAPAEATPPVTPEKEAPQPTEESEAPTGPLHWLRRKNQVEAAPSAEATPPVTPEKESPKPTEESEAPTGPLHWLRRNNQVEAAPSAEVTPPGTPEKEASQPTEESQAPNVEIAPARRTWMPPALARRFQREDECEESESSEWESDYDSQYDSDEYTSDDESSVEEEEVVFGCEDSTEYNGNLFFADRIVEEALTQPAV